MTSSYCLWSRRMSAGSRERLFAQQKVARESSMATVCSCRDFQNCFYFRPVDHLACRRTDRLVDQNILPLLSWHHRTRGPFSSYDDPFGRPSHASGGRRLHRHCVGEAFVRYPRHQPNYWRSPLTWLWSSASFAQAPLCKFHVEYRRLRRRLLCRQKHLRRRLGVW